MTYTVNDSLYARINNEILDRQSNIWIYGFILFNSHTCGCYFRRDTEGLITICVRTERADRYFKLKTWANVAQYTELTPSNPLPLGMPALFEPQEVEAFKYPFSKGFTFLPRFIENK